MNKSPLATYAKQENANASVEITTIRGSGVCMPHYTYIFTHWYSLVSSVDINKQKRKVASHISWLAIREREKEREGGGGDEE